LEFIFKFIENRIDFATYYIFYKKRVDNKANYLPL